MYRLQEIEVTATRASGSTPVAYTDLSHEVIARNSYGFDIPSVLALTPSMIATNETGIGIGGTSMRLRGTDATRLNVTINGVSMNNPDSHSMYWYDTPDLTQKEPTRSNFTDTKNGEYPTSERLYDWEFGYLFHNDRFEAGVNFYYMSYKDQLVATGELSDTGQELSRNIPDSYRRGIELSASLNIARWFSLGANATLSQNRIENYTEYVSEYDADWNYLGEKELYLGTSTLSYSPSVIAGVLLDFHVKGFSALLHTQYVGKQYFTNGRNDALSLDDYCATVIRRLSEVCAKIRPSIFSRIKPSGRSPVVRTAFQWRLLKCHAALTSSYCSRSNTASAGSHFTATHSNSAMSAQANILPPTL